MKPPPFVYRAPAHLDEALDLLAETGSDAELLAGGQSLLLDLRYGSRRPAVVIDLNQVAEFDAPPGPTETGGLALGPLVRHAALEAGGADEPVARLMRQIAPLIGHPPIRARGTFLGSLAWAHPAAEWCALTRALDGELLLRSRAGIRTVPAQDWFSGPHRTARRPDELVAEVQLAAPSPEAGVGFAEHRRTSGSFALAAAICIVESAGGRITGARIALANAADVPVRASAAEQLLTGTDGDPEAVAAAGQSAAAEADPHSEPHCSAEYRRHVLQVLCRRALAGAIADSRGRRS